MAASGFAPGGGIDIMARMAAQRMAESLGQSFVVDNRPRASGNADPQTPAATRRRDGTGPFEAYKCPGDLTINCRSYSINGNLGYEWQGGANTWDNLADGNYQHFRKLSSIKKPVEIITFLEENRVIMNDGYFVMYPQGSAPMQPDLWTMGNLPAVYHNGATGMSFADGHSYIKKWKDKVLEMAANPPTSYPTYSANKSDAGWIAERASHR